MSADTCISCGEQTRREQIARSSEKERRLFRQFMNDLLNFAEDCPKPNISKFINVWREEKGWLQAWGSPKKTA